MKGTAEQKLAFILNWIEQNDDHPAGSVQADTVFDEIGLDSLSRMTLAGEIFEEFDCEFEANLMWDSATPAELVEALSKDSQVNFLTQISEGEGPHVILVFGLGGTARDLFPIAKGLNRSTKRSVWALEQPFTDDASASSVEDILRSTSEEIVRQFGAEPVIPFGYSAGGLLAMGIAEKICSSGGLVPFTGLLDTRPPDLAHEPVKKSERIATLGRHLPGWISESILQAPSGSRKQGVRELRRELRHLIHALRDKERPKLYETIKRAGRPPKWDARTEQNLHSIGCYEPEEHHGDVLLLRAQTRPLDGSLNQKDNGWGAIVRGSVIVKNIQGTHASILTPARLQTAGDALADSIKAWVSRDELAAS